MCLDNCCQLSLLAVLLERPHSGHCYLPPAGPLHQVVRAEQAAQGLQQHRCVQLLPQAAARAEQQQQMATEVAAEQAPPGESEALVARQIPIQVIPGEAAVLAALAEAVQAQPVELVAAAVVCLLVGLALLRAAGVAVAGRFLLGRQPSMLR